MSHYLNYFIEFRDPAKGWKLLSAMVKKDIVCWLPECDGLGDGNRTEGEYVIIHKDSVCGPLRDALRNSAKGFPEDMSDGLRALCDKVDTANAADAEAGRCSDWRFNKGVVTLSELYSGAKEKSLKLEGMLGERRASAKLDYLIGMTERLVRRADGMEPLPEPLPDPAEEEELREEVEDCGVIMQFCESVTYMVNFLTCGFYEMEDVRIVYYIS